MPNRKQRTCSLPTSLAKHRAKKMQSTNRSCQTALTIQTTNSLCQTESTKHTVYQQITPNREHKMVYQQVMPNRQHRTCIIIIIIIYPLTMRVIGAPQMISQPISSTFPCSPLPSGTWRTPRLSIPCCCLPTSSSVCLVFSPLSLCLAR